MDRNQPPRVRAGNLTEPATARTASQQSRQSGVTSSLRSKSASDRRSERFDAAERNLEESYRKLRALGVDPDAVETAFAVLRDTIAEIKQCTEHARRELDLAHYEWYQASRRQLSLAQYLETAATSTIPDTSGMNSCPDPRDVRTAADFMDTLRRYWIWLGKPSYRRMERQCDRQFAASTIYTALKGNKLPSFDLVRAIIAACGGSEEHQRSFLQAWRRLQMEGAAGQPSAQLPRSRVLHAVSESA